MNACLNQSAKHSPTSIIRPMRVNEYSVSYHALPACASATIRMSTRNRKV